MPNNDEPVCKEKKQTKQNIDRARAVDTVWIHNADNFTACEQEGKNIDERSERTSTKLMTEEFGE